MYPDADARHVSPSDPRATSLLPPFSSPAPFPTFPTAGGASESVKVVVRCRPLNRKEKEDGRKVIVKMDTKSGQMSIQNPKPDEPPKTFTFDLIYDENVKQIELYNEVLPFYGKLNLLLIVNSYSS